MALRPVRSSNRPNNGVVNAAIRKTWLLSVPAWSLLSPCASCRYLMANVLRKGKMTEKKATQVATSIQ